MHDVAIPAHERVHPPAVSLAELWPWSLFAAALLLLVYFVGVDEGATSVLGGMTLHEWVHDGRHLLGFPCH
jgi:Probable cobalt transporter subunit (CbtB)